MPPSPLLLPAIAYVGSSVIAGSCIDHVPWSNLTLAKPIPFLLAFSIVGTLGYTVVSALPVLFADDDAEFASIFTIIGCLCDWLAGTTLDLAFVLRARALIFKKDHQQYFRFFMAISWLYGIADIAIILNVVGAIDGPTVNLVWSSFNFSLVANEMLMHFFLIYGLMWGDLAKRAANYHTDKSKLQNGYHAGVMCFTSGLYLTTTIYCVYEPILGTALIFLAWSVNLRVFIMLNKYIEQIYSANLSGTALRQSVTTTINSASTSGKVHATPSQPAPGTMQQGTSYYQHKVQS